MNLAEKLRNSKFFNQFIMKKFILVTAGLLVCMACSKEQNTQLTDSSSTTTTNSSTHYNSTTGTTSPVTGTPAPSDTPHGTIGGGVPRPDTGRKPDTVHIDIH